MNNFRHLLALLVAALLVGCSSAPLKVKDTKFATRNLGEVMAEQRIAIRPLYYPDDKGLCTFLAQQNKLGLTLDKMAKQRVQWDARQPGDAALTYRWSCESTWRPNMVDTLGAFSSLLTIGLAPTVVNTGTLSLDVTIERNSKKIFSGTYSEDRRAAVTAYGSGGKALAEDFATSADSLIARFMEELDRDGALDK
jgi:hypothetical protein